MSELPPLPEIVNGNFQFKALQYTNHSSEFKIETVEFPTELGPKDVLIKTKAASINPVDLILKALTYSLFGTKFRGFGGDFSGIVLKTGSDSSYKPGDKVFGDAITPFGKSGSFGEYFIFNEKEATLSFKIPNGLSFSESASLPIAGCTAFQALKEHADLKGKKVLILGGGTSVGSYGVQFAKGYFGASHVVATCSPRSSEKIKSFGADLTIDYHQSETAKVNEVLEFVKEHGKFDIILDTVRDSSFYPYSTSILHGSNNGGVYAKIAGSTVMDYKNVKIFSLLPSFSSLSYFIKSKLSGEIAKPVTILLKKDEDFGDAITKLIDDGKFTPVIDSEFDGYSQFSEAIEKVATSKASGKVICTF